MKGGVLDKKSILELIEGPEPLVAEYLDLDTQLQPNGFDLTLREVRRFTSAGGTGPGGAQSTLSESSALSFGSDGYLDLTEGAYVITLNEIVSLPPDLMALARPRSSLLRSGVAIHTAVWDAGYKGRSQALLTVYNPMGYRVARDARLLQMVFMYLARPVPVDDGYKGRFLGENVS